jgi:hypothetical protein
MTMRSQDLGVLLTPVKYGFTVPQPPVRNSSVVSLTPVEHAKTEKAPLTGVIDTGEKFFLSVNDTRNVCFAGVVDTSEPPK